MKAKTLQIVWHSKGAVYSVDFHPSGLLATGGLDKDIKVCLNFCLTRAYRALSVYVSN